MSRVFLHAGRRLVRVVPVLFISVLTMASSFLGPPLAKPAEARVAAPGGGKCVAAARVQRAALDLMRAGRSGSASILQRALERHVDMRRVMRFALGKHRRKLRPEQRRRFHRQARRYVARKLVAMGGAAPGGRVEVVRCRGSIVETRIVPDGARVLWRVRGGRIVDVNYRGMWMAALLRSHFDRMMRHAGGNVHTFLAQLK